MKNLRILKIIGGFCVGVGIGLCTGVAMDNIIAGLLLGAGIGICYAVVFSRPSGKD